MNVKKLFIILFFGLGILALGSRLSNPGTVVTQASMRVTVDFCILLLIPLISGIVALCLGRYSVPGRILIFGAGASSSGIFITQFLLQANGDTPPYVSTLSIYICVVYFVMGLLWSIFASEITPK